jgi:hypothetical protein
LLDPVFLNFSDAWRAQKRKYFGEFLPAQLSEGASGRLFLEFFQTDRDGVRKGVVGLNVQQEML